MLTEIKLKNFQAHRRLVLPLRPGLNVITGASDRGKSAIVRALRFLTLHESATNLTTNGEDDMAVRVVTHGHNVISRFKNTKEYGYSLNDLPKFLACARDQPIPITTVLNLTPENFQSQFDPHFLLSLTPGQVAKEINRIVALSDIDKALSWLKERIRSTNALLEASTQELVGIQEYLDANQYIPLIGDILIKLKAESLNHESISKNRLQLFTMATQTQAWMLVINADSVKVTACEALLSQGNALQATKATKRGLESIVAESRAIAALPTLEAVGEALASRLALGLRRLELKNFHGMLSDTETKILYQKSKIITLLAGHDARMRTQAVKSNLVRGLVNRYEEYHDEVDQHQNTERKLEQTLALRAVCSKCGRKY